MIEITYGKHSQRADLAGKSVAEVRELYKSEFSIPNRAKASLNGKRLEKKLELETKLGDDDKLTFEAKSRKGLVLLGAFLVTLALTGSTFAYAYTTASISLGTIWPVGADFANVTAGSEFDWWHSSDNLTDGLLGRMSGAMDDTGNTLFTIYPSGNYTGDLEIKVYLANAGHMRKAFKHFNMMLECSASEEYKSDNVTFGLLTLENAEVLWHLDNPSGTSANVTLIGGSWHTIAEHPLAWPGGHHQYPMLYCEVQPR